MKEDGGGESDILGTNSSFSSLFRNNSLDLRISLDCVEQGGGVEESWHIQFFWMNANKRISREPLSWKKPSFDVEANLSFFPLEPQKKECFSPGLM